MKKSTFIATTLTLIATLLFGGCGSKREEVSTTEATYVTQEELIETLNNRNDVHQREIKDLKQEVESLTAKVNKQEQQLSKANERIAQLEGKVPAEIQPKAETTPVETATPKVMLFYRGKFTEIPVQKEKDAIKNPVDIYEREMDRNLSIVVYANSVKNVYVNQKLLEEEITYNDAEQLYSFKYCMNGEGQYTFLVETDSGDYYFSVNY